ncbi:MAG: response regulator [Alphaproteobacteria bacterium]|nr:response regulator [Alphaproteobacteria bacterium]
MNSADAAPHLLVVDDDSRLRNLLRKYLSDKGYRVSAAIDAADARAKLQGMVFDLIILDLMMPGESGIEFMQTLRRSSQVPILMLTAMGEPADRIVGLKSGADDYLAKPFEPEELLLRIHAILRRVQTLAQGAGHVRFGEFTFDLQKGELRQGEQVVYLTTGEAALLKVFARSPGVTISRLELTRQTGGSEGRAVDVQITRLRRKIEPDPKTPRYLQTVWGEGYVLWAD